MGKRNADDVWEAIFDHHRVVNYLNNHDLYTISANEIKNIYKVTGQNQLKDPEPRLVTKFDHQNDLPEIFKHYNLSILPISRGNYVIGKFNAYSEFGDLGNFNQYQEMPMPDWLQSIDYHHVTSEPRMIDLASVSGMINDVFGKDKSSPLISTVSGRMGTGTINFNVNGPHHHELPIKVTNSQMEIDAGFENEDSLILVEAKMHTDETFLVRQLYYPYRYWSQQINKPVYPVYLQYSNGIYRFFVYEFTDPANYNSAKLITQQNYVVGNENISIDELLDLSRWAEHNYVVEPCYEEIPFPQANDLNKVMEVVSELNNPKNKGKFTKESLCGLFEFDKRQADYYYNAGRYLDVLIQDDQGKLQLTKLGKEISKLGRKQQWMAWIKLVLRHEPFNIAFKLNLKRDFKHVSQKLTAVKVQEQGFLGQYSLSTIERRASTINRWVQTIRGLVKD